MDDELRDAFYRELARVVPTPEAEMILRQAGYPAGRMPATELNRARFWAEVRNVLDAGAMVNGEQKLVRTMARDYPGNRVFQEAAKSLPVSELGRSDEEGEASDVVVTEDEPAGSGDVRSDTPTPRRRRTAWAAAISIALCLAVIITLLVVSHSDDDDTPSSDPSTTVNAEQIENRYDGKDPRGLDGGNSRCADPPDSEPVSSSNPPVYGVNGDVVGVIELRTSPICPVIWARVVWDGDPEATYEIPAGWTLHVVAHRPATDTRSDLPEPSSGAPILYALGSMLATVRGCVYVEAYFSNGDRQTAKAVTSCVKP